MVLDPELDKTNCITGFGSVNDTYLTVPGSVRRDFRIVRILKFYIALVKVSETTDCWETWERVQASAWKSCQSGTTEAILKIGKGSVSYENYVGPAGEFLHAALVGQQRMMFVSCKSVPNV